MPHSPVSLFPRRNAILAALPEGDREALVGELEHVSLDFKQRLQQSHRRLEHVWFPRSGMCCAASRMADGSVVELAAIGREGVIGIPLVLNAGQMAHGVIVQIPGEADRLAAATFTTLLERLPGLRRLVLRYTLAFVTQIAQGSACNRLHPIEARLARWLLIAHDRVESNSFPLSQEFLGQMLGVTRPSVSIATGMLQRLGLISYVRGNITVHDRSGLQAASCECYQVIADEFSRVSG